MLTRLTRPSRLPPTEGPRGAVLTLPPSGELPGSSSSEHGSVSPDSDAQPDAFFEKSRLPVQRLSHLLRYSCPAALGH